MNLNRATSKFPKMSEVETGTLYVCEGTYHIEGSYRFWTTGKVKIGQHTCPSGYYAGNSKVDVVIGKMSAIVFDRFPHPLKEPIEHMPVPDIIGNDTAETRMMAYIDQRLAREEDDDDLETIQEIDSDEYVSNLYYDDEYDETPHFHSEEPSVSESEQEDPRVGGDPEDRGEPLPVQAENIQETQSENNALSHDR